MKSNKTHNLHHTDLMFQHMKPNADVTYPARTAGTLITDFLDRWTVRPVGPGVKRVGQWIRINLVSSNWKLDLYFTFHHSAQSLNMFQRDSFKVHSSLTHNRDTRMCRQKSFLSYKHAITTNAGSSPCPCCLFNKLCRLQFFRIQSLVSLSCF